MLTATVHGEEQHGRGGQTWESGLTSAGDLKGQIWTLDHSGNWVENRFEGGKTDSQETLLENPGNKLKEAEDSCVKEMAEWMI